MNRSHSLAGLLVFATVSIAAGFQGVAPKQADQPNVVVRGSALGKDIQVLGLLNEPLGELLTIRGNMVSDDLGKGVGREHRFEVHQIGNRKLDEPIELELKYHWYGEKPVPPGTPLELIGFEYGSFSGIAPAVFDWEEDKRNRRGIGIPQGREWHFAVRFEVLQFEKMPPTKWP